MSLELGNVQTFDGSIANGGTEQLEVKTTTDDYVQVIIDDGTTGGTPPQYTITQDYYQPQFDDYMQFSTATGQTAQTIREQTRGAKLRFTFENTSGVDPADFRIVVQTFREV